MVSVSKAVGTGVRRAVVEAVIVVVRERRPVIVVDLPVQLDQQLLVKLLDELDAIEATEERLAFSDPRAPVFVDVGTGDGYLAIQMARGVSRSSARAAVSSGTL